MNLRDHVARTRSWLRARRGKEPSPYFAIDAHRIGDPNKAIEAASDSHSELAKLFYSHDGRVVDKWTHYLDSYDRHFSAFRNRPVRVLEIGVFRGGSLELWRKYFGPEATIYGVDLDPRCADFVDAPNQVRIGSQADPEFLRGVVAEMGGIDIVIDDGSHIAPHQRASFQALWGLLNHGGVYVIEDVHTAYWPGGYEGGYERSGSAIELGKRIVDDMHGWYHPHPDEWTSREDVLGIHFYDSIFFIEKGKRGPPRSVRVPLVKPER